MSHTFSEQEIDEFFRGKNDNVAIAELVADELDVSLPEIDIQDFRVSGYLPDVMINYLSLLGWNPGDDIEKFDRMFLFKHFSFDRVQKSPAKFDRKKLLAFNHDRIQQLSLEEFEGTLREFASRYYKNFLKRLQEIIPGTNQCKFSLFAQTNQKRTKKLEDPFIDGSFFLKSTEDIEFEIGRQQIEKALRKVKGNWKDHLTNVRAELATITQWNTDSVKSRIEQYVNGQQIQTHRQLIIVAQPLRVAATGTIVSPPVFDTLAILGQEATLSRIDHCLKSIDYV